ncbi:Mitochondrial potassium channel [Acropora cervicornis]|uniref:Mitochondrial potassium channel n=1 Tax=Acropora cervicornis TaxID=6130 RepID=A0AAD9UVP9_ACRCE|nr:Mitochondrial potassium channel [Acropora cervicornis]
MLSTKKIIRLHSNFGGSYLLRTRLFHKTSFQLRQNLLASWFSKSSTIVYKKGEVLLQNSYKRLGSASQAFDELLGISEVQEAQARVKKAENDFMKTRGQVQETKRELDSVQESLREIRQKLDRVSRDDERYLALATEEHKILIQEKRMRIDYETLEAMERDRFVLLSGAVRDSHEKERARAERTKHWSVIGSQIKNSIKETGSALLEKNHELRDLMKAQDNQMGRKASELRESLSTQTKSLEQKIEELGSLLNFLTLNFASEPLKEFGIHVKPPVNPRSIGIDQYSRGIYNEENTKEDINTIASRVDSVVESLDSLQQVMQGDTKTLLWKLEKLDSSVHHTEGRMLEELQKLSKSVENLPLSVSEVKGITSERNLENDQWWIKASLMSIALSGVILIYEIVK